MIDIYDDRYIYDDRFIYDDIYIYIYLYIGTEQGHMWAIDSWGNRVRLCAWCA
jgi:hypothetical protein